MRFQAISLVMGVFGSIVSAEPLFRERPNLPNCPPRPVSPQQQRVIWETFFHKFFVQRNATGAVLEFFAEDYIQHNPDVLSGRDVAAKALSFMSPETINITVINRGKEGDIAFVYAQWDIFNLPRPNANVDMFRFNGSCIQEHWDVIQPWPVNATNPLAMW
ncbi:hypothetical protein BHE90_004080 [Fusarium euwallaceae]|uniref:SnoaL-like domain-containing protein n=1 Tax=Fusarium euwallaceae TaxID=1147111 RepID=A0A430M0A2_9HYPO|nr:hypothetical protein BHE90_004080 [Fusarium euwallaceae]